MELSNKIIIAAGVVLVGLGATHIYPINPHPDYMAFFGQLGRDSLVVTNIPEVVESDPVFEAWKGTNTYVKTETDPNVHDWAKAANPPAETDPTVPSWAKDSNPPSETDPVYNADKANIPTKEYVSSNVSLATNELAKTIDFEKRGIDDFNVYTNTLAWDFSPFYAADPGLGTVYIVVTHESAGWMLVLSESPTDPFPPIAIERNKYYATEEQAIAETIFTPSYCPQHPLVGITVRKGPVVTDKIAKVSQIPSAPDFSTNNVALVTTITNLAPAKAKGISIHDSTRNCNWYLIADDGTFTWLVEE